MKLDIKHTSQVIYATMPDNTKAYIKYDVNNGVMRILETYVPPQHRGMGIARQLVEYAVSLAAKEGLCIEPVCSYAIHYFARNTDKRNALCEKYRDLSEEEWLRLYEEARSREGSKGQTS